MAGVEILATQDVAIAFCFNWEIFWIVFVGITAIGFFVGLFASLSCEDFINIVIGCILGAILGVIIGVAFGKDGLPTEYETQYKVTISDEVSMNDFLERYEIIDQEGKIYTVRERNGE